MSFSYTLNSGESALAVILALLPLVLFGVIMGTLTHKLAIKKGYLGYFWTGFFLMVIGLIYVVGLPNKRSFHDMQDTERAE